MKIEDSRRAVRLGSVALFLLAAGCNGRAGPPPTANSIGVTAQARSASPAQSTRKLYVSTIDGGSVVVYAAGGNPTLLQAITDGVPRPGGI